jgi:hypothetical protein
MAKINVATCPCGFVATTPHGVDEAVEVAQNHAKRIHPDDYPNGLSRETALSLIEEKEQ